MTIAIVALIMILISLVAIVKFEKTAEKFKGIVAGLLFSGLFLLVIDLIIIILEAVK